MTDSTEQVMSTHIESGVTVSTPSTSYTYYHAGPLFTLSDLYTNSILSQAISRCSKSKYVPVLPQDLEQRDTSPHSIRDQDIRALLSSDLALFIYDGAELDSGTVVEFMFAKMADIPAVIVRTDFRGAGDQHQGPTGAKGDPWNLMCSFYPRTERVIVDSMIAYKRGLTDTLKTDVGVGKATHTAGEQMIETTAEAIVRAFDDVLRKPAVLPKGLREQVYQWLALMPDLRDGGEQDLADILKLCSDKAAKGLL